MFSPRTILDRQLAALRTDVARLGENIEQSIGLSLKALQKQDMALANLVDQFDAQINARRFAIEEHAYQILALQQPNSSDMRAIVATVSVVTNLERIGDHAAGIARLAIRIGCNPLVEVPSEFGLMAADAQWMIHNAINAFISRDQTLAANVIARDAEIDALHKQAYHKLIKAMIQEPRRVESDTMLLWVSHNLERMGDRAANIAMRVTYLVTGELVRHPDPIP